MNEINESDLNEIVRLLKNISRSNTKSSANSEIDKFNLLKNKINNLLNDYGQEKLSLAFIYAEDASGKVSDKDAKIKAFEDALYKFERIINKSC